MEIGISAHERPALRTFVCDGSRLPDALCGLAEASAAAEAGVTYGKIDNGERRDATFPT
jgi:hypothetical protein